MFPPKDYIFWKRKFHKHLPDPSLCRLPEEDNFNYEYRIPSFSPTSNKYWQYLKMIEESRKS